MDTNVDFVIRLFLGNTENLKNFVEPLKEYFVRLVKYLKENACPPTMVPSKTQTMYKRRQVVFPKQVNQFQMNGFNTKYTNIANDKINKIKEIFNSKIY